MKWFWKAVKTITIVVPIIKGIISIWKDEQEEPVPPVEYHIIGSKEKK